MTAKKAKAIGQAAGFLSAWVVVCFMLLVLFLATANFIINNQTFLSGALRIN